MQNRMDRLLRYILLHAYEPWTDKK